MIRDAFRRRRPGVAKAPRRPGRRRSDRHRRLAERNELPLQPPAPIRQLRRDQRTARGHLHPQSGGGPRGLPAYYRTLRADIRAGRPIENKLHRGQVVEDTARHQRRRRYRPRVADDGFVLAIKNTREFLLRLGAVRAVMPERRIVACVRNPVDTIASWKASFQHLNTADVGPFVDHPQLMWLAGREREALQSVAATADLATRRALWWRFLADRVLEHRNELLLVRYEELVAEPAAELERILAGCRAGTLRSPVAPSTVRSRRSLLDDDDLAAISEICSPAADRLGLPVLVH